MFAASYPLLDVFLSILWFFLFFLWIYILISIFTDIFRSHDLSGGMKALWFLVVLVLPYLGAFIYLVARGGKMHEHAIQAQEHQQQAFRQYVQQTAGSPGTAGPPGSSADQLAKLAELRNQGVLTEAEFEQEKAKILA
ncbi:MAG: SHOCT domain-containing protein [Acidimicrobiales bacterium]